MEMFPMFAAMQKKNYKNESLVHIVNFTSRWPLVYREMFRRNCTINAKGKRGHNFAIDEYMETFVVKPIKLYARKQPSIEMLEKICVNLDLLEHVKTVYQKAFDTNTTGGSSAPDSMPDRIKVAWFALRNKWFVNEERKDVHLYHHGKKDLSKLDVVPKECINVMDRGFKTIKENFDEMIYRQFPVHSRKDN